MPLHETLAVTSGRVDQRPHRVTGCATLCCDAAPVDPKRPQILSRLWHESGRVFCVLRRLWQSNVDLPRRREASFCLTALP